MAKYDVEPLMGQVLLRKIKQPSARRRSFDKKVYEQPDIAEIVAFEKPSGNLLFPWDERIQVGKTVLLPVGKKQEFPDGQGGSLFTCYYSEIKVFLKKV